MKLFNKLYFDIYLQIKLLVKIWKLELEGQLRKKRINLLNSNGMDDYISEINKQAKLEEEKEKDVARLL